MKRATILAAAFAALLVVEPAGAADDEHPYDHLADLGAAHQIRDRVDWDSFDQAIARYPREDGGHQTIAIGNYLAWKLVNAFPASATVERLWLETFSEPCRLERGFGGRQRVHCSLTAELHVRHKGRTYRYRHELPDQDVGSHFPVDQRAYAPTRHAEVRILVDETVRQIEQRMQSDGIIEY